MTMIPHPIPPIAITVGEPAGIGAEISLRAAIEWQKENTTPLKLIGDSMHLHTVAHTANLDISTLSIKHIALAAPVIAGQLNPMNAPYVLQLLDEAITGTMSGHFSAMVTAPVQKSVICDAGFNFTGHTEYLAHQTHTKQVVMMLTGGGMRIALATTHLSLAQVPSAISIHSLRTSIQIILDDLKRKFGIKSPRLLVTGLNPHAGENGHMGREEIDVIIPVIQQFLAQGDDVRGPYPADTLFQSRYLNDADAVLVMYHDQGLPVLKYASFGHGINITLGLPIIRTSVDHGTALDLAGKNLADANSMLAAIQCAHDMIQAQKAG